MRSRLTPCISHEPLMAKLSELTAEIIEQRRDQGWLIRIGLAVIIVALAAIFQAGEIKATVERNLS